MLLLVAMSIGPALANEDELKPPPTYVNPAWAALAAHRDGDLERAVHLYTEALALGEMQPDNMAVLRNNRGHALEVLGDDSGARLDYEAAIDLVPDYIPARVNLGILLSNTRRMRMAEKVFTETIEIDPATHVAWYNRGLVRMSLGESKQAKQDLMKAWELAPEEVDYHETLNSYGIDPAAPF